MKVGGRGFEERELQVMVVMISYKKRGCQGEIRFLRLCICRAFNNSKYPFS